MRAVLLALVGVPSLALAIVLGVSVVGGRAGQAPVYSVAAVTGLSHDPATLVGRTLLVRGVAAGTACLPPPNATLCGIPRFSLRDPGPAAALNRLDLTWGPGDPLLAVLRRVPLLGAILPAQQVIRWEAVAVYRVRFRVERHCGDACYEALLLDAAPGPP